MEKTDFDYKAKFIEDINEDLERCTVSDLGRIYRFIRTHIIANVPGLQPPDASELAATVPGVPAANNRSDKIADIATSMECAAKVTTITDPSVVQCAIETWARQLRAGA